MAGEDLDLDESGSEGTAGKKGKHKPLTKGQKIGVGIGLVTILLIIYQVRKQSAANSSSSTTSQAIDPLTGYPSGSAQDQSALSSMYSGQSAGAGSYPGAGGGGGYYGGGPGSSTDTVPADLAAYFGSLPSSNPLSPNYVPPDTTATAPNATPTINVTVPPPTVITNPGSTASAQGGASTTHDVTQPAFSLSGILTGLTQKYGLKINQGAEISASGGTYVGLSGTQGIAAAKKGGETIIGGKTVPGGNPSANYVYVKNP